MRGNRTQKVNSASYQAFDSFGYPHLATLGISVDWNERYLLRVQGAYKPCFKVREGGCLTSSALSPSAEPRSQGCTNLPA